VRSSNNGHTAWNCATNAARLLTVGQHSTNLRQHGTVISARCLTATWAGFDEQGREFWIQMDALVDMLNVVVTEEADDA